MILFIFSCIFLSYYKYKHQTFSISKPHNLFPCLLTLSTLTASSSTSIQLFSEIPSVPSVFLHDSWFIANHTSLSYADYESHWNLYFFEIFGIFLNVGFHVSYSMSSCSSPSCLLLYNLLNLSEHRSCILTVYSKSYNLHSYFLKLFKFNQHVWTKNSWSVPQSASVTLLTNWIVPLQFYFVIN